MKRQLIPALLAAAAAGIAPAQPLTEQFLYQGELTDNGTPADGNFDFQFRLFGQAAGGSQIGNVITRSNIPVDDGYVQTPVNFGGVGVLFTGERRWLDISVRPAGAGSYTSLGRVELTATPYSSFALNAEIADFAEFSGTTLDDAYENGSTIDADTGRVSIINTDTTFGTFAELELGGPGSRQGLLQMNNFAGIRTLEAGSSNPGGYVHGFGATGDTIWQMAADNSSFGGGLGLIYRRTGAGSGGGGTSIGFTLEGNFAGTEKPRFTMSNDPMEPVIVLSLDSTGDSTVRFPNNAINALETKDEAGIASNVSTPEFTLSTSASTIDNIASATIACPTDGFVLAIATAEASFGHSGGQRTNAEFGISDTPNTRSGSQDIELRIDSGQASGQYDFPVTVHGVFPVNAGSRTFYFVGDRNSGGTVSVLDSTLSLIFVPTSYGIVEPSRTEPGGGMPDSLMPQQYGGLTPDQILRERQEAELVNSQRLERELDAMKRQIARIEREMALENLSAGANQ